MAWRRVLRLNATLGLTLVVYFVTPVRDVQRSSDYRIVTTIAALALLTLWVLWQLRRHVDDQSRRIDGLVGVILIVIVAFALAFYVVEQHRPGEIVGLNSRLDSLYFTVSTLLTIGYGDVHAAGQLARALVLVQTVFDVVFVATAASLLSSRVRSAAQRRAQERTRSPNRSEAPDARLPARHERRH
jgi:voltage-gated potassium channel